MPSFSFTENELTGARVTVPFTALQQFGPKHHAILLGTNDEDGKLWIAELSRRHGYQVVSLNQWLDANRNFIKGLKIEPNTGPRTNTEVAQSAVDEVKANRDDSKDSTYHVLFNNCETFADRQLSGKTILSPQVRKAMRVLGLTVAGGALILKRHLQKS